MAYAVGLQNLSVQQQQSGDEDLYEYNNQLRHGIFEAYSGILNGMSSEKVSQFLLQPSAVRAPSTCHESFHYAETTIEVILQA